MQPRFPKTRTYFQQVMKRALVCSFLLYLENKYIIRKVPLFKLFFNDSGDTVNLEQTQTCHIFHIQGRRQWGEGGAGGRQTISVKLEIQNF